MFDTMTMTKVLGGVCGAWLVFLLGGWAAEEIYTANEGGHGEHAQAYVIETGASDEPAEEGPSFEEVFASADAGAGEKVFRKCASCHKLEEGVNGTGPSLYGVVGRPVDSIEGFAYSGALEEVVDVWTPENLSHFIENPRGFAPGTAMGFAGLPKIQDRADLIAYLSTIGQ